MNLIESAVRTSVGMIRDNNEDNFYLNGVYMEISLAKDDCAHRLTSGGKVQIYAVCDGMGGHDCGELAAYTVVSNLSKLSEVIQTAKGNCAYGIEEFIKDINSRCGNLAGDDENSPGCTLAMICVAGRAAYIVNVGDSRVYLLRKKKLQRLTEDQTQAQLLVREGLLDISEADVHPSSHMLYQYVGMPVEPDGYPLNPYISKPLRISKGDMFLICSDGLTDMLTDDEISETVSRTDKNSGILPSDICKALVNAALGNGGRDNVTVMAVKF